jgi:hypothetical protein
LPVDSSLWNFPPSNNSLADISRIGRYRSNSARFSALSNLFRERATKQQRPLQAWSSAPVDAAAARCYRLAGIYITAWTADARNHTSKPIQAKVSRVPSANRRMCMVASVAFALRAHLLAIAPARRASLCARFTAAGRVRPTNLCAARLVVSTAMRVLAFRSRRYDSC